MSNNSPNPRVLNLLSTNLPIRGGVGGVNSNNHTSELARTINNYSLTQTLRSPLPIQMTQSSAAQFLTKSSTTTTTTTTVITKEEPIITVCTCQQKKVHVVEEVTKEHHVKEEHIHHHHHHHSKDVDIEDEKENEPIPAAADLFSLHTPRVNFAPTSPESQTSPSIITVSSSEPDANEAAPNTPKKQDQDEKQEESSQVQMNTPARAVAPIARVPVMQHILDELQQSSLDEFQRAVKLHLDALISGEQKIDAFLKWTPANESDIQQLSPTALALRQSQMTLRQFMHHIHPHSTSNINPAPSASPSSPSSSTSSGWSSAGYSHGWFTIVSSFIDIRRRDISNFGHTESSPYSNARDLIFLQSFDDLITYSRTQPSLREMDLRLPGTFMTYFEQTSLHFLLHPSRAVEATYERTHSTLKQLFSSGVSNVAITNEEIIDELLIARWGSWWRFECDSNFHSGRILQILKKVLPQMIPIKDVTETLIVTERTLQAINSLEGNNDDEKEEPYIAPPVVTARRSLFSPFKSKPQEESPGIPTPKYASKPEPFHSNLVVTRLIHCLSSLPVSIKSGFDVTNSYTILYSLLTLFRCEKMSGKHHAGNEMKREICLAIHKLFHSVATEESRSGVHMCELRGEFLQAQSSNSRGSTLTFAPDSQHSTLQPTKKGPKRKGQVNYKSWFNLTSSCYSTLLHWISKPAATKKAKNWNVCTLALIDVLCLSNPEFFLKEMSDVMESILYKVYNCVETNDSVETHPSLEDENTNSTASLTLSTRSLTTSSSSSHLHSIIFLSLSNFLSLYLRKVSVRPESVVSNMEKISELYIHKNKELLFARHGGLELEAWMSMNGANQQQELAAAHLSPVGFIDQQLLQELTASTSAQLTAGTPFTKPKNHIFERKTQVSLEILILTMALANHSTLESNDIHFRSSISDDKENGVGVDPVAASDEAEEEITFQHKRLSMAPNINFLSPSVTGEITPIGNTMQIQPPQRQYLNNGFLFVLHEIILPLFDKQQKNWKVQVQRRMAIAASAALVEPTSPRVKSPSLERSGSISMLLEKEKLQDASVDSVTKFGTEKRGVGVPVLVALQSLLTMFGLSKVEQPTTGTDEDALPSLVHQLSAQFPAFTTRAVLRCHPKLIETFFTPMSVILSSLLVECFKWVGSERLGETQVVDSSLDTVESKRRVHNSRTCLRLCLRMMTVVWPCYAPASNPNSAQTVAETAWTSYEMNESILLNMLIQLTIHQDSEIRQLSAHLLRTCVQEPQDGNGHFQPFFISCYPHSPIMTSFKPISRSRILNSMGQFLRNQPRWKSLPLTLGDGIVQESDLYLADDVKEPLLQTSRQAVEITFELVIEFVQIWSAAMINAPPSRSGLIKSVAEFDHQELEATLITWLSSDLSHLRWNVMRGLNALRTLNKRLFHLQLPNVTFKTPTTPAKIPTRFEEESKEDEVEKEIEPEVPAALPMSFITMIESCHCLSQVASASNPNEVAYQHWNGENILPNHACVSVAPSEATMNTDIPTHLVPLCQLRGEQWTTYLGHLLRHFKNESLSTRIFNQTKQILNELQDKLLFIRQTQAYWKKKNAWSITAALSNRKPEITGESKLTEEEVLAWRNLLLINGLSFASSAPTSLATSQDFINSQFLTLLTNISPIIRRNVCIVIGNWNLADWIGGAVLACMAEVQTQLREGSNLVISNNLATERESNIQLSQPHLDAIRVHVSHIFKLFVQHLSPTDLLVPVTGAISRPAGSKNPIALRSSLIAYLMSSYHHLVKGHAHNEFRWDFIEWRQNLARITMKLCTLTAINTMELKEEDEANTTEANPAALASSTPTRTPLLNDSQRKLLFEMFLSWCGYGPSSAAYTEKLKLHTNELLTKITDKSLISHTFSDLSESSIDELQQHRRRELQMELNQSIEELQLLSLQAMATLLRGKCFDPYLQSQLQSSVNTGDSWGGFHTHSLSSSDASSNSTTSHHAHSHSMNELATASAKGFVFPWLNALLISKSPVDRDVAYEALESFIVHNEHLLPSFLTHCYLVQTGSSIISKRYFLVIGNILSKQAEAYRAQAESGHGKMKKPRLLKVPLSVLLHLIIFKLGDLSFSVRSMALRLIPVLEHFYGKDSPAAALASSNPTKLPTFIRKPSMIMTQPIQLPKATPNNASRDHTSNSATPMQVIIGSHLPDTFHAIQLQLSAHFAQLFPEESSNYFNECGRRMMFLHRIRMGGTIGAGGNSVHINNLIEENIANMIGYLAPWLANIQLQPQALLVGSAVGASSTPLSPTMMDPFANGPPTDRRGRSALRTFSVLTAKKGPTEIMQQLLDFTFLFSSSSAPITTSPTPQLSGGLTLTAPYSVPSYLLQDLYTHLIIGREIENESQPSRKSKHPSAYDTTNPNLEILINFLFDSLAQSQRSGKLTQDWKTCYQRIALYLSRIAPDQTLKLLIGHVLHSSTNNMGMLVKPTAAAGTNHSKVMLTKSNFALMLLVEVAYELDLSGEESIHSQANNDSSAAAAAAAKRLSMRERDRMEEEKYPSSDESDNQFSFPSPSRPSTIRPSGRMSGGGIRVKQPLETVALLLHIGLLGLHYPAALSSDLHSAPSEQQQQISSFIRRHATSLLINLIQATVFQTSDQFHNQQQPTRGGRQSSIYEEEDEDANSCNQSATSEEQEELNMMEDEDDDDVDDSMHLMPKTYSYANSRHTLNLALAPLQLSTPNRKKRTQTTSATGVVKEDHSHHRLTTRYSKALQLINSLNQYLGWILCHSGTNDSPMPVSKSAFDDEVATDASCPVPGLELATIFSTLCRIIPAPMNVSAFVQSWFTLSCEWSCTCENDGHFKTTSLRLLELMTSNEPSLSRGSFPNNSKGSLSMVQPDVQVDELESLVECLEKDLQPWIGVEENNGVIANHQSTPQTLSQEFRTIQNIVCALVQKDEMSSHRCEEEDAALYEEIIPKLFWLGIHVISSFLQTNTLLHSNDSRVVRPQISNSVVLTCLEFVTQLLSVISKVSSKIVEKGQIVEWIWNYKPIRLTSEEAINVDTIALSNGGHHRRSSSFSNFPSLQTCFPGIQHLCHQLLLKNILDHSMVKISSNKEMILNKNTHFLQEISKVLSQLSQYTFVNDEEYNVVASLIDVKFVQHLQTCQTIQPSSTTNDIVPPPVVVNPSKQCLHPFLLNLLLQLPNWCLSLQSPKKLTAKWDEVAALFSNSDVQQVAQSKSTVSTQLESSYRQSANALCMIASLFHLPNLSTILGRFGSDSFHMESINHQQHHQPFLNEIIPMICEVLEPEKAPLIIQYLLDSLSSLGSWSHPHIHVASSYHQSLYSITYDILCSFMTHINWYFVEQSCLTSPELVQFIRTMIVRFQEVSHSSPQLIKKGETAFKGVIEAWEPHPKPMDEHRKSVNVHAEIGSTPINTGFWNEFMTIQTQATHSYIYMHE